MGKPRSNSKKSTSTQAKVKRASTQVKVKNVKGTSTFLPKQKGISSWKEYLEKKTPSSRNITKCAISKCKKPFEVGAHVVTKHDKKNYAIVNMCKKHNHVSNEKYMSTKYTSNIVPVTKRVTGGVPKQQHK